MRNGEGQFFVNFNIQSEYEKIHFSKNPMFGFFLHGKIQDIPSHSLPVFTAI